MCCFRKRKTCCGRKNEAKVYPITTTANVLCFIYVDDNESECRLRCGSECVFEFEEAVANFSRFHITAKAYDVNSDVDYPVPQSSFPKCTPRRHADFPGVGRTVAWPSGVELVEGHM